MLGFVAAHENAEGLRDTRRNAGNSDHRRDKGITYECGGATDRAHRLVGGIENWLDLVAQKSSQTADFEDQNDQNDANNQRFKRE